MEQELLDVPSPLGRRLLEGEPRKRGKEVPERFVRGEADGISPGVADVFDFQGVEIAGAEEVVVIRALAAVLAIGETLGPSRRGERFADALESLGVRHGPGPAPAQNPPPGAGASAGSALNIQMSESTE